MEELMEKTEKTEIVSKKMQTEHKEPEMVTDSVGKTVYVSVGDVDDNAKN